MEEWIRCVSSFEESEKIWSELTKTRPCPLKCNTRADVLFEEHYKQIHNVNVVLQVLKRRKSSSGSSRSIVGAANADTHGLTTHELIVILTMHQT